MAMEFLLESLEVICHLVALSTFFYIMVRAVQHTVGYKFLIWMPEHY